MASDLPPPEVSADDARRAADQVLSGREYVEAARGPSLRERLFDWIVERVADAFGALSSLGGRGAFAWVIIGIFAAAIVFVLSRLLRGVGTMPRQEAVPPPHIDITRDLSAAQWRAEAEAAEAAGDWRSGLRCRHRALVTELIEMDAASPLPGQTAGEIEREVVARASAASAPMRAATQMFNNVWYGGEETDAAERDEFARLSEQILQTLKDAPTGDGKRPMAVPS